MEQQIMTDPLFLGRKSVLATPEDRVVATDLLDTLLAHKDTCVGMAANMIGHAVRIIVVADGDGYRTLFNPDITRCSEAFETEEGCLSLPGTRKTKRYRKITVAYQNAAFQPRIKTFTGWTAQIVQHEIDHLNGILI